MARHRAWDPKTLKQTSICVIAHHFDRLWGEDFDSQFGRMPQRLLHVIGPFDGLPGHICEDVFHTLEKKYQLRSAHLHLLLSPQMTRVQFTANSAGSLISEALVLLSYRCKKLMSLDLTNCRYLSPQSIGGCLPCLTLLRTLILRQTKTKSAIVKSIASFLPHLMHLDLHGCPVSNSDAFLLCGDSGDFEPVCKKLAWLDISSTKIELTGCIAILQCFQDLRSLNFPDSVEAVAQLHKDEAPVQSATNSSGSKAESSCEPSTSRGGTLRKTDVSVPANRHKLQVLYASALRCRNVDPDSVRLACCYCPYVREVHLDHDATDETLKHLLVLQHLCVLEVSSNDHDLVTFHGGVRPLLLSRGPEMVELGLYNVQGTDLGMLGYLCPQLKRLKVVSLNEETDFAQSYVTAKQQADSYKALRQLTLVLGAHVDSLDPSDLLLKGGALEKVHLIGSSCFTDQRLDAALAAHGFSSLKELQVSCEEISVECVRRFVTGCPQLSWVCLDGCQLISRQDVDQLRKLIQKERLNINLEWS